MCVHVEASMVCQTQNNVQYKNEMVSTRKFC